MHRHLAITAALLVATSFPSAAHADIEMETLECTGRLQPGALTTPGYGTWSGSITCTLGHAGETGYFPMGTFSSGVTARIDNQPLAGTVRYTVADLAFSDESYTLHAEDANIEGYVAMTNEYDAVSFGHAVYKYHVRAGYLRPACGLCLADSLVPQTFYFYAEYVYDLPVA